MFKMTRRSIFISYLKLLQTGNLFESFPKVFFHCSSIKKFPEQTLEEKQNIPVFKYASSKQKKSTRVYTWGLATTGALGESRHLNPTRNGQRVLYTLFKPGRLRFAETHDVTDVSCGCGFTVFAVKSKDSKKVFGTGINTSSQIGVHEIRKGHPLEFILTPRPIHVPFNQPSETKVLQVACGRAHTIIVTDKEGIFSLGNNSFGQCGRPIVKKEQYFGNPTVHKVRNLDDVIVSKVICGQDHTLFLTSTGKVYSCGLGSDGQTGIGHYNNLWEPTLIAGDIKNEKIIQLSSSGDCVLAVSEKGDVFGWGNSEYKQLILATDEQQICHPRHLKLKVGKVVEAAAAGTMCAVLNDQGVVFVWGFGLLGKGPAAQHISYPEYLPKTLFGCNDFSPDVYVAHVYAGLNHFAAVTNKGDLYMWGKNTKSCLGIGHPRDQYFPYKVSMPAEVLKISCGVDHTAAFCRSFV